MTEPEEILTTEELARAIISGTWTPGVDDEDLYRRIRNLEAENKQLRERYKLNLVETEW